MARTIRHFRSFAEIAEHFEGAARVGVPAALGSELDRLGYLVSERARSYLGHPQTEGHDGFPPWRPLAESTLERKGANTPLLQSGEMRESIQYHLVSDSEVQIGSNAPYAKYQEHGTADMPARPFLEPAAMEVVEENLTDIGAAVVDGLIAGKSMTR